MDPAGTERHDRRIGRRALVIVASLVPFVATTSLLWFRSAGAESAASQGAADVARIVCRGGTTTVETPIVRAQIDGVHLLVESDVQGLKFSLNDGGWKLGWEDSVYPVPTTQWLPPGVVEAQCGTSAGVTDGVAFEVIDPERLWHDGLACIESGDFDQRASSWFYADVNPMPEAIARAIPGVRASDVIDYYGYPHLPGSRHPRATAWSATDGPSGVRRSLGTTIGGSHRCTRATTAGSACGESPRRGNLRHRSSCPGFRAAIPTQPAARPCI